MVTQAIRVTDPDGNRVTTLGYGGPFNRSPEGALYSPAIIAPAYAALTPGIIYFPIPKLGISATVGSVGYSRLKETPTASEPVTTTFDASFGLSQLQFGGTWYFGR